MPPDNADLKIPPPKERWLPVVGYEGLYEVSDLGQIRNLVTGKLMALHPLRKGYLHLGMSKNGERRTRSVARTVATAFIPNPLSKPLVNHKDGCKTNNHIENLEWATDSENQQHSYDTGLRIPLRGDQSRLSKFSNAVILEVKNLHATAKYSWSEIAEMVGISKTHIGRIVHGKCRAEVMRDAGALEAEPTTIMRFK